MAIEFIKKPFKDEENLSCLESYVKEWFIKTFKELTPPQKYSFKLISNGYNVVITAPTGSGKTIAGFLSILSELFKMGKEGKLKDSVYCIYVSPLKALDNDIKRNLLVPLKEIREIAKNKGIDLPEVRIAVRSGDVTPNEKQKQLKQPPHILITTPESLAVMLNAPKFSKYLSTVKWVIIDEIHELANNKRGVHLSLSLERLQEIAGNFIRIGLGATLHPIEEAAAFLVGYNDNGELRDCKIVDVSWYKPYDLKVLCPVKDIIHSTAEQLNSAMYKLLDKLISKHRTTLIFTNTRSGTERVVFHLKDKWKNKYSDATIGAHHGSLSRDIRLDVENKLKQGLLKAVICVSENSNVLSNPSWRKITEITSREEIIYLDQDLKLKKGKFDSIFCREYKDYGFKIKSRLGYEIECTKEHKFLTIRDSKLKWIEAKDLKCGDKVAVIRNIPIFSQYIPRYDEIIPENAYVYLNENILKEIKEEIKIKFGSIKNLCKLLNLNSSTITHNLRGVYPIKFANLLKILSKLGKEEWIKEIKVIRTNKTKHPLFNKKISKEFFRFLGFYLAEGSCDNSGISIAGERYLLEFYSKLLAKDFPLKPIKTKNPHGIHVFKFSSKLLRSIFEKLIGDLKKKSIKGDFPSIIYKLPEEYKWCFLSGYFDGDGYSEIKNKRAYSLGFSTFNKKFAKGLQTLLLQLGIIASIREREYNEEQEFRGRKIKKKGICYTISIYGGEHLRKFAQKIKPKKKNLRNAINHVLNTKGYCNRDIIPNISELLREIRKKISLSTYKLQRIGYNPEKVEIKKRNISRRKLQTLIKLYEKFIELPELLKNLAYSHIFWDEIIKKEPIYLEKVYSLVDTSNHNYVIDGFICQNSSTSLELGIDIGYIDLVVQIGSPKSVTRAIQRIGRSGHKFGDVAKGIIIAMDRDDLVECAVMLKCALEKHLDKIQIPKNCLDVLAQHIVGMALNKKWNIKDALKVIKRSYCYHDLDEETFKKLLHYLAGHYSDLEDQRVYGKIWFDENDGMFGKRGKYTRIIYYLNIGTIPDEVKVDVYKLPDKKYIGNIEEGFLERLKPGDIFVLGGKLYEFRYARAMRCYVSQAPKEAVPTIPAWFSELLPLSFDLALEIQKFRKEMKKKFEKGENKEEIISWLINNYPIDKYSAHSIYEYFKEQYEYCNIIPSFNEILIEETYDLHDRKYIVFHSLYGRRTNDVLSRIVAIILSNQLGKNIGVIVSDNGFALHIPKKSKVDINKLLEEIKNINPIILLRENIRRTELMNRRFRHCASRSFLILRNYKGYKISVSKQQTNAQTLIKVCEEIDKNFPIIEETYREILEDVFDIENALKVISWIKNGKVKINYIKTNLSSPFAHNLIILGEADIVLMEDRKKALLELHEAIMKSIQNRKD